MISLKEFERMSADIDVRQQDLWENQRKNPSGASYDAKFLTSPADPSHWAKLNGEGTEFSKILIDEVEEQLVLYIFREIHLFLLLRLWF